MFKTIKQNSNFIQIVTIRCYTMKLWQRASFVPVLAECLVNYIKNSRSGIIYLFQSFTVLTVNKHQKQLFIPTERWMNKKTKKTIRFLQQHRYLLRMKSNVITIPLQEYPKRKLSQKILQKHTHILCCKRIYSWQFWSDWSEILNKFCITELV